jgi:hypothetical protein
MFETARLPVTLILILVAAFLLKATQAIGQPSVAYTIDADSSFDPYAGETAWLQGHVSLIEGYGSFGREHYCGKKVPAIDYHDFATEGYAPLTPTRRAEYMAKVEVDKAAGCAGVFNDDINLGTGYRDGSQDKYSYEPEAREIAALIAQERAYWPGAVIENNVQWHDLKARQEEHDPSIATVVDDSSLITKEFGVGPTAGINSASDYNALLAFADHHPMAFAGDYNSKTVPTMEYNLATSLLVGTAWDVPSGSYVGTTGEYNLPPTWWSGVEVNLGTAYSTRFHPQGQTYWARYYSHGVVIVDPPGHGEVNLGGGCNSPEWKGVNPIILQEKQAVVCTR